MPCSLSLHLTIPHPSIPLFLHLSTLQPLPSPFLTSPHLHPSPLHTSVPHLSTPPSLTSPHLHRSHSQVPIQHKMILPDLLTQSEVSLVLYVEEEGRGEEGRRGRREEGGEEREKGRRGGGEGEGGRKTLFSLH